MNRVPLSEEQINEILESVPYPPGAGKFTVEIARKQIQNQLEDYLRSNIKLPPIPEAFQQFKDELLASLFKSFVPAGTPVGIMSATALAGPVTQLTLNSFHSAGQESGVATAFEQVRNLLTGSQINRNPGMILFFKVPGYGTDLHDVIHTGSVDNFYQMESNLRQTTVADVVNVSEVIPGSDAINLELNNMLNIFSRIKPNKFIRLNERFRLTYVIRLQLDLYRMYSRRLTMADVAKSIETGSSMVCVWSSQLEGNMFVLPDESKEYGVLDNRDNAILLYLNMVIKGFDQKVCSGIPGILSIEPIEVNIVDVIDSFKPGKVLVSEKKSRLDGPSLYDVYQLLNVAGFEVTEVDKSQMQISVNYDGDIETQLNNRIKSDPEVERASKFAYLRTNGENFQEIVWRDDIDINRSYPIDSHMITSYLGIDAARLFLTYRFTQTLESFSSYIDNKHIQLIFDMLTNLGTVNSLTLTGINRRSLGPLAAAASGKAMEVFASASITGNQTEVADVSTNLYVGRQSKQIGTGSVRFIQDEMIEPQDAPSMITEGQIQGEPTIHDLGTEFEEMGFSGLVDEEEPLPEAKPLPVNKTSIGFQANVVNNSLITDIPTDLPIEIIQPNPILIKALNKVTGESLVPEQPPPLLVDIQPTPQIVKKAHPVSSDIFLSEEVPQPKAPPKMSIPPSPSIETYLNLDQLLNSLPASIKSRKPKPIDVLKLSKSLTTLNM